MQILKNGKELIHWLNVDCNRHTSGFLRIECGTVNTHNYECKCDVTSVIVDGIIRGEDGFICCCKLRIDVISC